MIFALILRMGIFDPSFTDLNAPLIGSHANQIISVINKKPNTMSVMKGTLPTGWVLLPLREAADHAWVLRQPQRGGNPLHRALFNV
jgi:hypothetical protein